MGSFPCKSGSVGNELVTISCRAQISFVKLVEWTVDYHALMSLINVISHPFEATLDNYGSYQCRLLSTLTRHGFGIYLSMNGPHYPINVGGSKFICCGKVKFFRDTDIITSKNSVFGWSSFLARHEIRADHNFHINAQIHAKKGEHKDHA
jgi:hypothetical protein